MVGTSTSWHRDPTAVVRLATPFSTGEPLVPPWAPSLRTAASPISQLGRSLDRPGDCCVGRRGFRPGKARPRGRFLAGEAGRTPRMDIVVESWSELHEALFADTWQEQLGLFRSNFAFRGCTDASGG